MKVYIVESQSQYDGGYALGVFSTEKKARDYIETQQNFNGWCEDDSKESKGRANDDFFYVYDEFEIDEEGDSK